MIGLGDIVTERLVLRAPGSGDRAALVGMLTDRGLMADLYPELDEARADAILAKHERLRREGLGFLAVARREDDAVIGFCGLKRGEPNAPIRGEVEAGWIIDTPWWRRGYAFEAMEAVLDRAWNRIEADRIYAITAAINLKSQGLMARLGMRRLPDGDYPSAIFPDGHRLNPMVTFAIDRP